MGEPFGLGSVLSIEGGLPGLVFWIRRQGGIEVGSCDRTTRAINGAAKTVTWAFDALGRVTSEGNVLGTFTYTYDGSTSRVATVAYPNGQLSEYAYFGNTGDRRLQTIHHKYPTGATLSKFDYTYDAVGNITTWRQQADATAVLWRYAYDGADQLVAALKETTDGTPVLLKRYAYAYDPAGNRTVEQIDDQVTGASYDVLNRLISQQPAGQMVFQGSLNEPALVTVQGVPAVVGADHKFTATVPVGIGTNTVTVAATDPSGNVGTRQYEVDSLGAGTSFTYDANGNLTADGTRTFEWDARNQLHSITNGPLRFEFQFGSGGVATLIERQSGTATRQRTFIWSGFTLIQERDGSNQIVSEVFELGERRGGNHFLRTRDHLLSTRELVNVEGAVHSRVAFEPFGKGDVSVLSTEPSYGGLQWIPEVGAYVSMTRAYDPNLGRWLSLDPAGDIDGPNLYSFVSNNSVRWIDPVGSNKWVPECWDNARKATVATFGSVNPRRNHCLASCLIQRYCGGGTAGAAAGWLKETGDLWDCLTRRKKTSCDTAFQPTDVLDNMRGLSCPFWKSCVTWCQDVPPGDSPRKGPLSRLGR